MTLSEEQQNISDGVLAEEELLHHFAKITKELEFYYDMPFIKFWAYTVKLPLFIDFLDEFLQ